MTATESSKNRLYREAQILNFLGWLSGELPELHHLEVPKLREAWIKWRDIWWSPDETTAGHRLGIANEAWAENCSHPTSRQLTDNSGRWCTRCGISLRTGEAE